MAGKRYVADCRAFPGSSCSLTISGTEQEVMEAAMQHAQSKHGFKDTPETRQQMKQFLKEEVFATN